MLGHSLRCTATEHNMILLHTRDVDEQWLQLLRAVGWELRRVEHLECQGLYNGSQKNRFAGTFTKLHAIALEEFYKVLLLDADVIIRRNVDHLFNRACPAALRRDAAANTADGECIDSRRFYGGGKNKVSGGINAGVMLLKPWYSMK